MDTNIIPKFCCLTIISFLMLVLFYYLNKYNETYQNNGTTSTPFIIKEFREDMFTEIYNTPLECEDHIKFQSLPDNLKNLEIEKKYELNKTAREFCELKCKPTNCIYKEFLEKVPDVINTLNIKTINNNLILSWLSPHSEHPILKYLCVIESNNKNKPLRVEVPIINNNDIVEHIITGLDENDIYTLKLFSENKYGLSEANINYNLNIKELKKQKEEDIPSSKNTLKTALNSLLIKNLEKNNFKIDIEKIEEKYNVKKKIILNYLFDQYKKLNDWRNKKTVKII